MAACEDLFRDALTLKVALHLVEASKLSRLVTKVCGFLTVRSDGSVMRGICQLPDGCRCPISAHSSRSVRGADPAAKHSDVPTFIPNLARLSQRSILDNTSASVILEKSASLL